MSFVVPERTFGRQPGRLSALLARVDRDCGRLEIQAERSPEVFAALALPREELRIDTGEAPVTTREIARLHALVTGGERGRSAIRTAHPAGPDAIRWRPWETPRVLLDALVVHHNTAVMAGLGHPVVLTAAFLLDFVTLCPLVSDNRNVARTLAVRLLAWHGHEVVRYEHVDAALFGPGVDEALASSQEGWAEGTHSIWPWTTHVVETLARAYERVGGRVATGAGLRGQSKQERVRRYVLEHADETFRISQIRDALPEVSDGTIRLALETLKRDARITLRTPGRDATWQRLRRSSN